MAGAEKWAFTPRLELGRNFGPFVVGGQLGALLRSGKTDFGNSGVLGSEVNLGAVVATTGAPLRGELSVRGGIGREVETTMEILAGARYTFCSNWEAFALGGPGFFEAPGTPRFRGVLGVAWVPAAPKAAAPAAAPAPVAVAKADPCAAGQAHTPEQCPALDDDKDGILNKDDACPTVAGIAEEKGCPAKDTDKDGILDHQDKCPTVPGLAELQGCPAVDTDGDGVPDHQDKCPTLAGVAAEAGCPPAKAKRNTATGKIDILEKVYFDTSKATIQDRSYPLLDEVAGVLKNHPELTRVVVEGHTDNTGAADFNTWLSGERAKAVKAYLVGKGIEAGRLDSKGFGPSKPVGDNKTKEGREQNRCGEFTIPERAIIPGAARPPRRPGRRGPTAAPPASPGALVAEHRGEGADVSGLRAAAAPHPGGAGPHRRAHRLGEPVRRQRGTGKPGAGIGHERDRERPGRPVGQVRERRPG